MIDCLIIGYNDPDFETYVDLVRSMGEDSGAYRDLNLAIVDYDSRPRRSMDLLNQFYWENKPEGVKKQFHNADFLWPVITYLGSYLSKRGFTFDYVNLPHLEKDKLKEKLQKNDILTIAITTTLYVSPHPIMELVPFIREHNQSAKILVGGPYISNQPRMTDTLSIQRLFRYIGADIYVISQEGEAALVNTITALKRRQSLDGVDNIAYRQGQKYVMTATSTESNPLEENMVDYTLFPKEEIDEFVTLRTAKSCPFSCSFCGFPQRAGKYKYLSVELVERELNAIRDIGTATTLTFIDDTFNVPKERFRDMLRMMIRNNYGFKWNSFYRSDHGDEQTIELMAKAGCEGVFLGIESGSDEMLLRMNKTARRKDYVKSIPLLRQAGISTHANVIVGFPGETYQTYEDTVGLIEETKPDFFRAQLWYADPVTPIWNQRDEYGVKGSSFNWSHNTMDYQTGCDLVDKMFLSVEGSVWLPQNGFEQWSTFYLQRKGMTLDQIKTFLKCFNALIKQKLIDPKAEEADAGLVESLRASCKFDEPARSDMRPVDLLSGANYSAAEHYWVQQFGEQITSEGDGMAGRPIEIRPIEVKGSRPATLACDLDAGVTCRVQTLFQERLPAVGLAAYGVLLSQLNAKDSPVVLSSVSERGRLDMVPLKLQPSWDLSFSAFVEEIEEKLLQGREHQAYALHILSNPIRMARYGSPCPVFGFGYIYSDADGIQQKASLEDRLKSYPDVIQQIGLTFKLVKSGERLKLEFCYDGDRMKQEVIGRLDMQMASIFSEVSENPGVTLREIGTGDNRESLNRAIKADASEGFSF